MLEQLRRAAGGFVACFPHLNLDRAKFSQTLEAVRGATTLDGAMGALAVGLLAEPPVDDMLFPFLHAMLVRAAAASGATTRVAEELAAAVILKCTAPAPLAGLRIAIGAPRGDTPVNELARHDLVITPFHEYVLGSGGFPTGPQEHGHGTPGTAPADQWHGHVQLHQCTVSASHDALVLLSGRSVGVGEALGLARSLRIPVIRVDIPVDNDTHRNEVPSCRLSADGETVLDVVESDDTDDPSDIALEIMHRVLQLVPTIRERQRARLRKASELHSYRQHLASAAIFAGVDGPLRAAIDDPLRFLGLSELERDEAARRANAMSRTTFIQRASLPRPVRDAYDLFIESRSHGHNPVDEDALMRTATNELAMAGSDTRRQRPQDWTSPTTWERLAATLPRA